MNKKSLAILMVGLSLMAIGCGRTTVTNYHNRTSRNESRTSRNESRTSRDESRALRDESRALRDESRTSRNESRALRDESRVETYPDGEIVDPEDYIEVDDKEFREIADKLIEEKFNTMTKADFDLDIDESHDVIKDKATFLKNILEYMKDSPERDKYKLRAYLDMLPDDYLTSDMYLKPTKYYGGYRKSYKGSESQDLDESGFTRGQVLDLLAAKDAMESFAGNEIYHTKGYVWSNDMDKIISTMDDYIASSNKDLHIDYVKAYDGNTEREFHGYNLEPEDRAYLYEVGYDTDDLDSLNNNEYFKVTFTIGDRSKGDKGYGWAYMFEDIPGREIPDEYVDALYDNEVEFYFHDLLDEIKKDPTSTIDNSEVECGDDYYAVYVYDENDHNKVDMIMYTGYSNGVMVEVSDGRENPMSLEECKKFAEKFASIPVAHEGNIIK